jgi:hypothetical protein
MGIIDDKKNVFTTIGAYTSLREEKNLPDTSNLFPSINNKDDIGAFLLDVLGVVVGTTALQELTGELFANFADAAEPTLKSAIKKQLIDFNSGDDLPNAFKTGIEVPVANIDVYGKLKNNPSSDVGKLLYDDINPNFDKLAFDAISSNGSYVTFNNLRMKYESSTDSFTFRPTVATENDSIGTWFSDFVDNATILERKEFSSKILDRLFASIASNEEKTTESIFKELEADKLIQQVIDGDDSFVIPEDDYEELLRKAKELNEGVLLYDMGCGLLNAELALTGMTSLISNISGSTDPNKIGNEINNSIATSFEATDFDGTSEENAETIRNGFFARLIQFLQLELTKLLTLSPQARMLLSLSSAFQNGGVPEISDPRDDLKNFKVYIKCVIRDALAALYEFIFNIIVTALVALLGPIIKQVIIEKINAYIGVIRSLISSQL